MVGDPDELSAYIKKLRRWMRLHAEVKMDQFINDLLSQERQAYYDAALKGKKARKLTCEQAEAKVDEFLRSE